LDSSHGVNPNEHWIEDSLVLASIPSSSTNWLYCFGKVALPLQALSLKCGSWLGEFFLAITAYGSKSCWEALYSVCISSWFLGLSATGGAISAKAWPPSMQWSFFEDQSHFSTSRWISSSGPSLQNFRHKVQFIGI
jgi:hypothetical protein